MVSITSATRHEVVPVHTLAQLERGLTSFLGPAVTLKSVLPHPGFSRFVCLWTCGARPSQKRARLRQTITRTTRAKGLVSSERREPKWRMLSSDAVDGLATLEWRRIRRIVELGPWAEQLLYQLKLQALSLYDPTQGFPGCPHSDCVRVSGVNLHHIFWTCPAARRLRRRFIRCWEGAGLDTQAIEEACFGLTLPSIPPGVWAETERIYGTMKCSEGVELTETVTKVTDSCWRLGVVLYFQAVWRWRTAYFDTSNDVSAGHHLTMLDARLRSGYATVHLHLGRVGPAGHRNRAAQVLRRVLTIPWDSPPEGPLVGRHVHLLSFDGSSRGNPGPGGSGAVVIQTSSGHSGVNIVWASSMSYAAKSTTNNVVENLGLLMGLRACHQNRWAPPQVIGDSRLIIKQQIARTPPKARHLLELKWQIRRLADQLQVSRWHHHRRSHNKMADLLANLAMDSKKSFQCELSRLEGSGRLREQLDMHVANDVGHWRDRTADESSSELGALPS